MTKALLEVKELTCHYKLAKTTLPALNHLSLAIPSGTTYGLVGESGCGKSTAALSIARLQKITSGSIFFEGRDITHLEGKPLMDIRKKMRMLFQNPEMVLNPGMTIREILTEETLKLKLTSQEERTKLISETLEKTGLSPRHLHRYPRSLSTGEKQRAALTRALITLPSFLLLDEPVASLDLSLKAGIINLLIQLQKDMGLTYLFISHNLGMVKTIAQTIGVMYMGYLIEEAPVKFFSATQVLHPYSRLLLASVPSIQAEQYRSILQEYPDAEPQRLTDGCPFRNRCPLYKDDPDVRCTNENPTLQLYTHQRRVACHKIERVYNSP